MRLKTLAAVAFLLGLLIFTGCGSNDPASSVTSSQDAGESTATEPAPFKNEPEEIWKRRLAMQYSNNGKCEVRAIRDGHAQISLDNGQTWQPAKIGMKFPANSALRTDSTASMDFSHGDFKPSWTIAPQSFMRIVRLDIENTGIERVVESMIDLERGRLSVNVNMKWSAASSFLVRTHRGIIEPFGIFEAEAEGAVTADGGRVHAGGETHALAPRQRLLF